MPNRLATAITTWRTYRRGRVDGRLPIVAYPAGAIPAAAAARLEEYATPLRAAGFVHALDCGPRDRRAAIQNHCSVLFHPDEQLRAWVMDLESEHSVHTVVELTTRFADGRAIGTLNTTMPPIFDRPPWLNVEVLPGATVDAMLASHRPRVAAVDAPKAEPWDADPLTTAAHENEAVLAYQAERGLLAEKDGDYGYTGRGAVRTVGRVARAEPDQSSGAA